MYSKILIANRGEVAVRIIRTCKEMGIKTVAVYSDADGDALHTEMADESYCIGGARSSDSYLNMNAIMTVALNTGVKAIHPGYGMLSENPEFARMCEENGIDFIGPDADVIRKMGHKEIARSIAISAGVPVIKGSEILEDVAMAKTSAADIGYPVILKARAGGGGKGIRIVRDESEIEDAFNSVKKEAAASFGDDALFLEKYLENVKHVEVQILADKFGNIALLGDRDCSVQRKNQKLLEECPAGCLSQDLRAQMYDASKRLAKQVNYSTVGTVEYLVKDNEFYFMEMNTRLQVEHSVTEMVYGIDIVKWQIRTAAGVRLPDENVSSYNKKCAIECRICAEDPVSFLPTGGEVSLLHVPGGPDVRFDCALYQNCVVSPFYDSMLGKLIVSSFTREEAIRKMKSALSELVLAGVNNNRQFHMRLMENEDFISGTYDTAICQKV